MIELCSESAEDTRAIAAAMAGLARRGDLVVLAGQMGAGKTAFAQGFARALGVLEPVTSPTYTLIHTYPACSRGFGGAGVNTNSITLHHCDLYRLEHTDEVADLALPELLDDGAIVLVEWGDVVDLGKSVQVELRPTEDDGDLDIRCLAITSNDPRWDLRWERLEAATRRWAA